MEGEEKRVRMEWQCHGGGVKVGGQALWGEGLRVTSSLYGMTSSALPPTHPLPLEEFHTVMHVSELPCLHPCAPPPR